MSDPLHGFIYSFAIYNDDVTEAELNSEFSSNTGVSGYYLCAFGQDWSYTLGSSGGWTSFEPIHGTATLEVPDSVAESCQNDCTEIVTDG